MKVAYFVKISGRVTGVCFRYSALEKSKAFPSLTGYIRNSGYREVEALVQGEPEEVDQMVSWMRMGPSMARVDNFTISECPLNEDFDIFRVKS